MFGAEGEYSAGQSDKTDEACKPVLLITQKYHQPENEHYMSLNYC